MAQLPVGQPQVGTVGPFLPTAGGIMRGILTLAGDPVAPLQAATQQYVLAHGGGIIDAKVGGAIGDGDQHPLSSITLWGTANTTGWTLGQWQAVFPFATALSNELDQCAILLAIQTGAAQHKEVYVPGGRYQFNFTPSVTVSAGFTFRGGGAGTTCLEVTNASATALPITVAAGHTNQELLIELSGFSVYSTLTSAIGGTGIVITGPTAMIGRPEVRFRSITVGSIPDGTSPDPNPVLALGIQVNTISTSFLIDCAFWGSENTTFGSPFNLSGTGFQSQGNSTFFTFGPYMVNCEFSLLNNAVVIGNGTTVAFTQGVKFTQCTWDFCNNGIVWRSATPSAGNDYLSVEGCDMACTTKLIWTDGVGTHQITNNYFLCGGATALQIDNTGGGTNIVMGVIAANNFCAFGSATAHGLVVNNEAGQSALLVTGNTFFDFSGTSAPPPITLNSGTSGLTLIGNVLRDNFSLPSDLGTSNHWYNTTVSNTTSQLSSLWTAGVPTAFPIASYSMHLPTLAASTSYANDTAAGAGGVIVGQFYRNGSVVQIRVT